MCAFVSLILIIVPVSEIILYLFLIDSFGFLPILLLTLFTSFIGSSLLQIHRTHSRLDPVRLIQGNPQKEIADHFGIWLSALLLLFPGFITDLFGALLLIPPFRYQIVKLMAKYSRSSFLYKFPNGARPDGFNDIFNSDHADHADDDIIDLTVHSPGSDSNRQDPGNECPVQTCNSSVSQEQDEIIDVEYEIKK